MHAQAPLSGRPEINITWTSRAKAGAVKPSTRSNTLYHKPYRTARDLLVQDHRALFDMCYISKEPEGNIIESATWHYMVRLLWLQLRLCQGDCKGRSA